MIGVIEIWKLDPGARAYGQDRRVEEQALLFYPCKGLRRRGWKFSLEVDNGDGRMYGKNTSLHDNLVALVDYDRGSCLGKRYATLDDGLCLQLGAASDPNAYQQDDPPRTTIK